MYAPVCTRFRTYEVDLDEACSSYCATVLGIPEMVEWIRAAEEESDDLTELDMEF